MVENSQNIALSAVIPVYNEAENIYKVIASLKNKLADLNLQSFEIITVNDGSTDESKNILQDINGIKVITHSKNKGYGASLKTGIKNSQHGWILIIDSDGTYPIEDLDKLLAKTSQNDLVIGSREKKDNAIQWQRKHAKMFLNKFASYLSGQKIPDLNSGMRIFKKEIVFKYWELFPNKFSFTSTLTMVCLTHGYETIFVPIDYYKRSGKSSIKPFDFFNFLKLVTKLSLFFKPLKVFGPISVVLLLLAVLLGTLFLTGVTPKFWDVTFIVLCATALQTFFFGLLAEITIHNK
jgi:glycosyltransferase involved in cell wall biosynthesis